MSMDNECVCLVLATHLRRSQGRAVNTEASRVDAHLSVVYIISGTTWKNRPSW